MATKKRAKKRLPKPVPWVGLCVLGEGGEIRPGWCGDRSKVSDWKAYWKGAFPMPVIRVRIVPVVAKAERRKGAK